MPSKRLICILAVAASATAIVGPGTAGAAARAPSTGPALSTPAGGELLGSDWVRSMRS